MIKREITMDIKRLKVWLALLLFLLLITPALSQNVYKWKDDSGVIHFTDDAGTIPEKYRTQVERQNWREEKTREQIKSDQRETAFCTRVIDGDTIVINREGKIEKVRLIGVDTPETKHPKKPVQRFGKEAYLFTKEMVEGKEVRLESDQQRRDRYGRLLAYVYLMDGTFLNAEIIRQGYGFAYTRYPFKYMEKFRGYEREARENKRGMWE